MDRHDLPETVNAEHVAKIHQEDLKVEKEFGCRGLTYWFDGNRKTAFCLIEAPNKKALEDMHNHAHGAVPNSIIEVDPIVVESFLGRIEDPKAKKGGLNVIDDPAFKILMVLDIRNCQPRNANEQALKEGLKSCKSTVEVLVSDSGGRMVRSNLYQTLASFDSAQEAINCSLSIRKEFLQNRKKYDNGLELKIGISCGVPFKHNEGLFEKAVHEADRFCQVVHGDIVISAEVSDLYHKETTDPSIHKKPVRSLNRAEEEFVEDLMDFIEGAWNRSDLKVDDFSLNLGLSKSQLYRKLKAVTNSSLNEFLKKYRLEKALASVRKHRGNISEIAFDSGFNSPAYFSKCFYSAFGVLPSQLIRSA